MLNRQKLQKIIGKYIFDVQNKINHEKLTTSPSALAEVVRHFVYSSNKNVGPCKKDSQATASGIGRWSVEVYKL